MRNHSVHEHTLSDPYRKSMRLGVVAAVMGLMVTVAAIILRPPNHDFLTPGLILTGLGLTLCSLDGCAATTLT